MRKTAVHALLFLMLALFLFAQWPLYAEEFALKEIASSVKPHRGSVVWSPDGTKAAYIGRGVFVHDIQSGKASDLEIEGAHFLLWSESGLYALAKEGETSAIAVIDAGKNTVKSVKLGFAATALYPSYDGSGLIALSESGQRLKIGIDVTYKAYEIPESGAEPVEIFSQSKIVSSKGLSEGDLKGWALTSNLPLLNTLALMEYLKPPAAGPHIALKAVNFPGGKARDLGRSEGLGLNRNADWSPDGIMLAIASGGDWIWMVDTQDSALSRPVGTGFDSAGPVSWNPAGSQIYISGNIVNSDGTGRIVLMEDGRDSLGAWSPDGGSLLIARRDGRLLILSGFKPAILAGDRIVTQEARKKIKYLKGLESDGLISAEEFSRRFARLAGGTVNE